MRKHHLMLMFAASLSLAILPACGDPEDPANNDNNENNPKNNENNPKNNQNNPDGCGAGKIKAAYMGGASKCYVTCVDDSACGDQVCKDADAGAGKICVPDTTTGCGTGETMATYKGESKCWKACATTPECGDAMQECKDSDGGGAKVCVPKDVQTGPCVPDENFKGQMGGMRPEDGGNYVNSNATIPADAGVKAGNDYIKMKFMSSPDDFKDDAEFSIPDGEKFTITDGIIAATAFGGIFIVQDQNGALYGRFPQGYMLKDKDGNDVTFKVGQKVSFTASKLVVFGGNTPQVSAIENLEIKGEGNDVWVQELSGQDIDPNKWGQIIRVGGKITAANGGCGGDKKCYEVKHGMNEDKTIILRTNSNFIDDSSVGDCITWVGPLSTFPGPLSTDTKDLQLNSDNYSWLRSPFKEQ